MNTVPWHEEAVAIRTRRRDPDGFLDREVVAQGPFWMVLMTVELLGKQSAEDLAVSFPDRGVRPFQYSAQEMRELFSHPLRPRQKD